MCQQREIIPVEECAICMEEICSSGSTCVKQQARIDGCNHDQFCFPCIERWATTRENTCPLCKARFTTIVVLGEGRHFVKTVSVEQKPSWRLSLRGMIQEYVNHLVEQRLRRQIQDISEQIQAAQERLDQMSVTMQDMNLSQESDA